MALLLAALCANGESIIDNAQIIDRGYERVDRELRRLGADIVAGAVKSTAPHAGGPYQTSSLR